MFANLFPKRDRFTPANVRRLADALARTPAVTPANGDHLVETFREIAELMIYGDQNDPSFFDLFVELKVMSHISRFVKQSGSRPGSSKLTLQLLQTLSIMIQNTREETSLFYLFSNDHVPKELIEHDFDFDDEEVLAYYISFLKTVSLKLNPRTIQFFFFTGADNGTRRSRVREPQHPDASAAASVRRRRRRRRRRLEREFSAVRARDAISHPSREHGSRGGAHGGLELRGNPGRSRASLVTVPSRVVGVRASGRGARRGDDGGAYGRDAGRDERWTRRERTLEPRGGARRSAALRRRPGVRARPESEPAAKISRRARRRSCGRDSWNPR